MLIFHLEKFTKLVDKKFFLQVHLHPLLSILH